MNTPQRSQLKLYLLIVAFAAPVVLAFVLSLAGFRPVAVRNHGTLVEPPVPFAEVTAAAGDGSVIDWNTAAGIWHVLVVVPQPCDAACLGVVDTMRRVWLGAGKSAGRVQMLYVGAHDDAARRALAQFPQMRAVTLQGAAAPPAPAGTAAAAYIVDPNGYLVLRYEPGFAPAGLRADLKRLVK